ncbi:MAG: response regulator [Planctomycetes bacterium]|nr:response regulator [Planctomycetota bacterium]
MAVQHHIKVLVVDKSPSICDAFGTVLKEGGFCPRPCSDSEAAVAAAEAESFPIAVVDLEVSPITGLDLLARLKKSNERMSCLVTTEHPSLKLAVQAMRAGASDYLVKPVRHDDLADAVDRACQALGLVYTNEGQLNRLIGQRIRAERLAQNLTLRQLSDRTDLTTSQLSQVELGKNAASLWALARISNSLGQPVHVLLDGL